MFHSIRVKTTLLVSGLLVVTGILLSFITFYFSTNLTMDIATDRAKIAAERARNQLKTEDFIKLMDEVKKNPSSEENQNRIMELAEYTSIRENLVSIREASGLRYIYTMVEANDKKYMYIVDGSPDEDVSNPGVIESESYPLIPVALQTGKTAVSKIDYSEKWGPTISCYAPIMNQSGKVIGIVGADFDATAIDSAMSQNKKLVIGVVIGCLTLSLIVGFVFSGRLTKPLILLEEHVHVISEGNLTNEIAIQSKDEIGRLANEMNTMVKNLYSLITTITQTSEQVSASSEELTANAEQSAQVANKISESIRETARTVEKQSNVVKKALHMVQQISEGTQQGAETAGRVAQLSISAAKAGTKGHEAVQTVIQQMESIQVTTEHSAKVIINLGDRSKEIGQIVDTISTIASQTNLLALNAAIEAARAGEQGRGFAVVAEEVRKLAEQSQEAAKQIAQLIKTIQQDTEQAVKVIVDGKSQVERGTEVAKNAGKAFEEIEGLIKNTASLTSNMSESSTALVTKAQGVSASVGEINEVSQAIASHAKTVSVATEEQFAAVKEVAAASQGLAQFAEELQTAIKKFKI